MIAYKEFQPRKTKQARKQFSQTKMNLQNQQVDITPSNNSMEYDITKDPAKIMCYHCQQEEHYAKFSHGRINNCTMEMAKVRSLQGCYQKSVSGTQPERSIR